MTTNTSNRIFAYCRVSTSEQDTANQTIAIRAKGYTIPDHRIVSETISGGVAASQRPQFNRLLDKLEQGDTLVVLKLDRLGRNTQDILATITGLTQMGINVVSLDLPVSNLASAEGQLMLTMFAAVAQFEKDRLRERTLEGLERAKADGKKLGRPVATDTNAKVQQAKQDGLSQSQAAVALGLGIATVKRHWKAIQAV